MKTITFPVGYRPGYLIEFLDDLKKHDLSDYTIVCSAEDCLPCLEILDKCILSLTILRNESSEGRSSIKGVRVNPYNALNYVFNVLGSDFNVHLEDDLVLAPDVFCLSDWYYNTYKDTPLTYMSYGLFNHASNGDNLDGLEVISMFEGLGWCTFKEGWNDCFSKYWFDDTYGWKHFNSYGWDWAIHGAYTEFGYKGIRPLTARTNHNGRIGGTHALPAFHDATFKNLKWNETQRIKEFKLVK